MTHFPFITLYGLPVLIIDLCIQWLVLLMSHLFKLIVSPVIFATFCMFFSNVSHSRVLFTSSVFAQFGVQAVSSSPVFLVYEYGHVFVHHVGFSQDFDGVSRERLNNTP